MGWSFLGPRASRPQLGERISFNSSRPWRSGAGGTLAVPETTFPATIGVQDPFSEAHRNLPFASGVLPN